MGTYNIHARMVAGGSVVAVCSGSGTDEDVWSALSAGIPNATTLATYKARLQQLKSELGAPSVCAVIRRHKKHIEALKAVDASERSPLTTKNLVASVLAVFKHDRDMRYVYRKEHEAWVAYHQELKDAEDKAYRKNEPLNDRQEANYVSIDEVQAKFESMVTQGAVVVHKTLKGSMQVLLMGFYTHVLPKRSDYGALKVFRRADKPTTDRYAGNSVYLPSSKKTKRRAVIVLRQHKTSSKYAEIIEEIPPPLVAQLEASLEAWPRDYVFVDRSGNPFTNNGFTKYVIRTFAALFDGRGAGTSLLRHAYISERVDFNRMSLEQREDIARLMGHTTGVQETVYKWVGKWRPDADKESKGDSGNGGENAKGGRSAITCVCSATG